MLFLSLFWRHDNFNRTFSLSANDSSNSPFLILPPKCSISGKTGLSDSNLYNEGRSGNFEQLDKPSFVSDLVENMFFKGFN